MASSEPLGSNSPQCSVSRGLFHSRCAENVQFENEKQVAYLKGGFGDYVFSANPIPVGEMFQVKILEKRTGWLPLVSEFKDRRTQMALQTYSKAS